MWYAGGEDLDDTLEDLSKKELQQQKDNLTNKPHPFPPAHINTTLPQSHTTPTPHFNNPSTVHQNTTAPSHFPFPVSPPAPHKYKGYIRMTAPSSPLYIPSDGEHEGIGMPPFSLHSSSEISPANSKPSSRLSTPASSRPATPTNITLALLAEDERIKNRRAFAEFLRSHTCYDIMPASVKIVVLDTKLAIQYAFQALEENGIKAAPLWDSSQHEFAGMITVSDFIDILLKFCKDPATSNSVFSELATYQIKTWRENNKLSTLISIEPDQTLLEASHLLVKNQIHRLPVIDNNETNSVLHIMTHYRILNFLVRNFPSTPLNPLLSCTIGSLGIGTYDHVVTVLADTPLIVVLDLLAARKISAVPIVDETGVVIDVYSKSDAPLIVKMGVLSPTELDRPVNEILQLHAKRSEQIVTCLKTETLKDILDKCLLRRVHRLIIVDSTKRVEGIVSLSDILKFFLT